MDELLSVAFAIYNNPGVYALLLGSGVSSAAEIRTGWEIVQDLIHQISVALGEEISSSPETWYEKRFGEIPRYDTLLEQLGAKPSERNAILRRYFESSEEERQRSDQIKRPTSAHRAIAQLIKDGYIHVVLTTNFDRLLEMALEEVDIIPNVVSTESMLNGARPPQHSPITIYKLNGDYQDENFKNIAVELDKLSDSWKELLHRVFDEYGLIVCGWSADWDIALRAAIQSAEGRRYSIYWGFYAKLTDSAENLIRHRGAQQIGPISADEFFGNLQQMVAALDRSNREHPLSVRVAAERTRILISREDTQSELEELFRSETERAYDAFTSKDFDLKLKEIAGNGRLDVQDKWNNILDLYYSACEIPLSMAVALSWYGKPSQTLNIRYMVRRWIDKTLWQNIRPSQWQYLPSLLLMYVSGIAAIYKNNWEYLAALYCNNRINLEEVDRREAVFERVISETMDKFESAQGMGYRQPLGVLMQELLYPLHESYLPSPREFEIAFDRFEALLVAIRLHETRERQSGPYSIQQVGVFGHETRLRDKPRSHEDILEFWANGGQQRGDWGLLQAGLFSGDTGMIQEALAAHKQYMEDAKGNFVRHLQIDTHYYDAYFAAHGTGIHL